MQIHLLISRVPSSVAWSSLWVILWRVGPCVSAKTDTYGRFEIATNPDHAWFLDTATGRSGRSRPGSPAGLSTPAPHTEVEFYDPKTYDSHAVAEPNWP